MTHIPGRDPPIEQQRFGYHPQGLGSQLQMSYKGDMQVGHRMSNFPFPLSLLLSNFISSALRCSKR